MNLPDPLPRTVLRLRDHEREIGRALLATYGISPGGRWLGLQPGRRDPEATLSAESFVEVSQELRRELGCPVLVFRGPAERTSIATDIAHRLGASVLPLLPVRHYAAVLEGCALFLTSRVAHRTSA